MTNANEIQIHAPFPRHLAHGEDIYLDASNWYWLHCLTIPVNMLPQFSIRPYKWLRFAIGIVLGAEGDLSSNPESLDLINYNASLSLDSATFYYYLSDAEKRRMFPLDPQIARSKITSSATTPRREHFRSEVGERDGNCCVLLGIDQACCDAVHLVAHNKGDTYISTLTERRSRDPARRDVVDAIDSIRNGLFMSMSLHPLLGRDLAFLATPNFALETSDVVQDGIPGQERCTAHLFRTMVIAGSPISGPIEVSGCPIRISDTPDWPPTTLLDVVYASAVFYHFATQALKDGATSIWNNIYYPGGAMNRTQVENKSIADRLAASEERHTQQIAQRNERGEHGHNLEHGPDTFDMLLVLPYILLPQDDVKACFDYAEEKVAEEHRKQVEEKVESWRKQVCANTPAGLQ